MAESEDRYPYVGSVIMWFFILWIIVTLVLIDWEAYTTIEVAALGGIGAACGTLVWIIVRWGPASRAVLAHVKVDLFGRIVALVNFFTAAWLCSLALLMPRSIDPRGDAAQILTVGPLLVAVSFTFSYSQVRRRLWNRWPEEAKRWIRKERRLTIYGLGLRLLYVLVIDVPVTVGSAVLMGRSIPLWARMIAGLVVMMVLVPFWLEKRRSGLRSEYTSLIGGEVT